MRIVLYALGTRGDVWPSVALGSHLARRDHDVTVATTDDFRSLVEHGGMRFGRVPADLTEHLATDEGQRLLTRRGPATLRGIQRFYNDHADAIDTAFEQYGHGAEVVVANIVTWDRTQAVGDAQGAPVAMIYPQPAVVTSAHQAPVLTGRQLPRALNRASNDLAQRVFARGSASQTAAFRARLGLPTAVAPAYRRHQHDGALGLCTWSPSLLPRGHDYPAGVRVDGAWQLPTDLRARAGDDLPPELAAWIAAGDPPVFLGFGSMPVPNPEALLDDIAAVTARLGLRAIVSVRWPAGTDARLPGHVRLVGQVDHDRLLPRCAAAVHHGGCGTTAASTRAGIPTVVCSVFADQPWWGALLARRGVGVHLPFRRLERPRLEQALRAALEPTVRERARRLGEQIRAEGDGCPASAVALDDWLITAEPTPGGGARPSRSRRPIALV